MPGPVRPAADSLGAVDHQRNTTHGHPAIVVVGQRSVDHKRVGDSDVGDAVLGRAVPVERVDGPVRAGLDVNTGVDLQCTDTAYVASLEPKAAPIKGQHADRVFGASGESGWLWEDDGIHQLDGLLRLVRRRCVDR